MVDTYPAVVIHGATGCGKTTQVPQFVLEHCASQGVHCNIVVTQPRRIAAISVANRVCQERQWTLGTIVGYQVGLDNKTSADTRLAYVTTGVLLEKLIAKKDMNDYTHVIIDEVHERDQETDFLLLVVRKFLRTNSRGVRVILMSATFDVDCFTQYFATPLLDMVEPAPIVEIPGKMKEVKEFYINSLYTLGDPMDCPALLATMSTPAPKFSTTHRYGKKRKKSLINNLKKSATVTSSTADTTGTVGTPPPADREVPTELGLTAAPVAEASSGSGRVRRDTRMLQPSEIEERDKKAQEKLQEMASAAATERKAAFFGAMGDAATAPPGDTFSIVSLRL
ncbi:hypothetical protein V5799_016348, partial [Amblyomma americanum]